MHTPSTPADIARVFTEAWTSHDLEGAATFVAADVVFTGPNGHSEGIEAYKAGLATFAQAVTGLNILAVLGDDRQAMIMYEVTTGPFGTLTCAEWLTFAQGKIANDRLTFDTFPMRGGAGAPPSAQSPST
jgi:hypothetical protein